jgi:HAD superfamily hydrolase (TIGR01509 family)
MAVAAVLFDFDGLLMDTETTSLRSWQHEWRFHGLELDTQHFFAEHGGDLSQARYAQLAAAVGPAYDQAASHARRTAYREQLHQDLGLLPGLADWLQEAATLGLRIAVATSSGRGWAAGHLSHAGVLTAFEFLACGDEVAHPKPDPGVYHLALQRLALPARQVVAVEDSPHGVAAAQAAGLRCVAIPNPHLDPARFNAADLVLSSAREMSLEEVIGRW